MVPRAERPELVARMRAQGLTQQEIADTAGVAESTIRNDLNRNFADEPAPESSTITNARGQQRPASYNLADVLDEYAGLIRTTAIREGMPA